MKKIAVYTAVIGGYDTLVDPTPDPACDYICFTDSDITSNVFQIRKIERKYSDPARDARMYKILSHQFLNDYSYSLWIDGSVTLSIPNMQAFVADQLREHDISLTQVPGTDDLYQSIEVVIHHKKDDPELLRRQVEEYRKAGYPPGEIICATGVIARNHQSAQLCAFNEAWWREVTQYSKRDQVSFNYTAWREKVSYKVMDKLEWNSSTYTFFCRYFSAGSHRRLQVLS